MYASITYPDLESAPVKPEEACRRFGITGQPIPATQVYRRIISTLARNGIRVERWVLVNTRGRTVTYASTYNGVTGTHYNPLRHTETLRWEQLRMRLTEYQYVPVDECPIAVGMSKAERSNPLLPPL